MQSLYEMIFGQATTTNNITSPMAQQAMNQAFNQGYQQYQQNQLAAQSQSQLAQQQYNQALGQYQQNWATPQPTEWMINGRAMSFTEFVDTLCPDPEDPMRSLLILKYSGIRK